MPAKTLMVPGYGGDSVNAYFVYHGAEYLLYNMNLTGRALL